MPQKAYFPPIHFICAHGAWHDRRRPQPSNRLPAPDTHINLPLPPSLVLPNGPGSSIVVEMPPIRHRRRPSVAHKDSFFTVYHCRSTHLRARRPPSRRSFPRSRNGTSRLSLRGKEGGGSRRRRRSGGSGGTYSWSLRPATAAARARSEAMERGREGSWKWALLAAPRAATSAQLTDRPTNLPFLLPSFLFSSFSFS